MKAAETGESVGITHTDQIFIERGHVGTHEKDGAHEGQQIRARIFWIQPERLLPGKPFTLRRGTRESQAEIVSIEKVVDAEGMLPAIPPAAGTQQRRLERRMQLPQGGGHSLPGTADRDGAPRESSFMSGIPLVQSQDFPSSGQDVVPWSLFD